MTLPGFHLTQNPFPPSFFSSPPNQRFRAVPPYSPCLQPQRPPWNLSSSPIRNSPKPERSSLPFTCPSVSHPFFRFLSLTHTILPPRVSQIRQAPPFSVSLRNHESLISSFIRHVLDSVLPSSISSLEGSLAIEGFD